MTRFAAPLEKLRVVVADDDAVSRALMAARVQRLGHSVRTAANGLEAWEMFLVVQPNLVIADWQMPEIDGLELCRRIHEHAGDECFIMLVTSRDGEEDVNLALGAGADDYLTKPVTAARFRARIVIAQRRLELARARRAAEAEAVRMRWLAGVGQTVLTLQHEINNPLTALFGSLEALNENDDLSGEYREHIDHAMNQAERISDVVRRLSLLERPSTVELIPGMPMLALSSAPEPEQHTRFATPGFAP